MPIVFEIIWTKVLKYNNFETFSKAIDKSLCPKHMDDNALNKRFFDF